MSHFADSSAPVLSTRCRTLLSKPSEPGSPSEERMDGEKRRYTHVPYTAAATSNPDPTLPCAAQ